MDGSRVKPRRHLRMPTVDAACVAGGERLPGHIQVVEELDTKL